MYKIAAGLIALAAFASAPACKKGGGGSCADVTDHIEKITGIQIPADQRQGALDKCEKKMTPEQRACALKADNMGDLMKCK